MLTIHVATLVTGSHASGVIQPAASHLEDTSIFDAREFLNLQKIEQLPKPEIATSMTDRPNPFYYLWRLCTNFDIVEKYAAPLIEKQTNFKFIKISFAAFITSHHMRECMHWECCQRWKNWKRERTKNRLLAKFRSSI